MDDFDEKYEQRTPAKLDFSKRASTDSSGGKKLLQTGSNRAIKLRLLSLVGLLLLVVVAMKEAGKPERWMWLGFDEPSQLEIVKDGDVEADDIVLQTEAMAVDARGGSDEQNGRLGYMPDRIAQRLKGAGSNPEGQAQSDDSQVPSTQTQDPQQTAEATDFWRSSFLKLNGSQKEAFYQLLRRVDGSEIEAPENEEAELPFEGTIKKLIQLQENNQAKALSLLARMSEGDRKTKQTERLFAFDESWLQHVLPAMKASAVGEDFTIANQAAIRSVRSVIDPIVLQDVEDMTGIGNPRDKLAWRAVWDYAQRDSQINRNDGGVHTTLLQLTGQPSAFRNQAVSISGTALTIRRKTLEQTMLDLDHYYELWIDPPSRVNDGLVCVYAAKLPSGFEEALATSDTTGEITEQFQIIKVPVSLNGRFFKIRSYQDAGKSVSHCPVVIAETFTADFQPAKSTNAASWRPSTTSIVAFFVLATLAAIAIAIAVYKSTQSSSKNGNRPTSKRVARSLDALTEDETVMTDAQRVSQLNDQLEEDFS